MTIEISVQFGPIKGTYKKAIDMPIVTKPCERLTYIKDKRFQKGIALTIHGGDDGTHIITEKRLGENK